MDILWKNPRYGFPPTSHDDFYVLLNKYVLASSPTSTLMITARAPGNPLTTEWKVGDIQFYISYYDERVYPIVGRLGAEREAYWACLQVGLESWRTLQRRESRYDRFLQLVAGWRILRAWMARKWRREVLGRLRQGMWKAMTMVEVEYLPGRGVRFVEGKERWEKGLRHDAF